MWDWRKSPAPTTEAPPAPASESAQLVEPAEPELPVQPAAITQSQPDLSIKPTQCPICGARLVMPIPGGERCNGCGAQRTNAANRFVVRAGFTRFGQAGLFTEDTWTHARTGEIVRDGFALDAAAARQLGDARRTPSPRPGGFMQRAIAWLGFGGR